MEKEKGFSPDTAPPIGSVVETLEDIHISCILPKGTKGVIIGYPWGGPYVRLEGVECNILGQLLSAIQVPSHGPDLVREFIVEHPKESQ